LWWDEYAVSRIITAMESGIGIGNELEGRHIIIIIFNFLSSGFFTGHKDQQVEFVKPIFGPLGFSGKSC